MPTLRVLSVFKTIYESEKGLTLTEISRNTGIAKGTLHPIVATLLAKDYLENTNNLISLGKSIFKLGYAYTNSINYLKILKPHMREIVNACDEICQLGVLDGRDVLYIEKTEPKQAIRIASSAGKTMLAYATALGKCLLSELTEDALRELYPEKVLFTYTLKTISDKTKLFRNLQEVKKNGYAHEIGESNIDIECFAVPIRVNNKLLASLSVSLPIFRSSQKKVAQIIEVLQSHERAIEDELASFPGDIKLLP